MIAFHCDRCGHKMEVHGKQQVETHGGLHIRVPDGMVLWSYGEVACLDQKACQTRIRLAYVPFVEQKIQERMSEVLGEDKKTEDPR
jgi:hypothetical protein